MNFNEKLTEQPDHKHYPACHGRKVLIEKSCQKIFSVTIASAVVMIMATFATARFPFISLLPLIFGESYTLGFLFVQLLELLGMILLAALGCGKSKICNVILLFIYMMMVIFSFITFYGMNNLVSAVIGLIGTGACRSAVSDFFDYRQLENTEGFPHFSERLVFQEENSEYVSMYKNRSAPASQKMDAPSAVTPLSFTGSEQSPDMPEMPELPEMPSNALSGVNVDHGIFTQESGKFCTILDSPMKTL